MALNMPKFEASDIDYSTLAKSLRDIYEDRDDKINEKNKNMMESLLKAGQGFGNYWYGDKAAMEARLNEAIESGDPAMIQAAYNNLAKSWKFNNDEKNYLDVKRARALGMSNKFDGVI